MVKSRGYKADDLFELRTMADPQISPNGSLIACSVSEIDRALDAYRTSIWLYEDGAVARELTLSGSSNSQPRWSPDGSWLQVQPVLGQAMDGVRHEKHYIRLPTTRNPPTPNNTI